MPGARQLLGSASSAAVGPLTCSFDQPRSETPLALTSSKKAMMFLKDKWKKIHRLIYVVAILGVVHFIWLVKKDLTEPLIYAVIVIALMLFRFKFKKI